MALKYMVINYELLIMKNWTLWTYELNVTELIIELYLNLKGTLK